MFADAPHRKRDFWVRSAFFFGLWLVVAGWSPKDLPVGLFAAGGAGYVSLLLLPPGGAHPQIFPLFALLGRFLRGSVVAGFDVARRALSPQLDIDPGFVVYPLTIAPGVARNAFSLNQSLQPGTLPTGEEGGRLFVHGLDIAQPIAANLAADEAAFKKATGHE
ncbi:Na+/H+ antiporter subunit E [Rhodoblastus acidophilus]|uniref:Na+/H+ antiporter subunit E n=1 Tax=Candidatus Rhodoblastus alkanivorans TaxID=2954117 RepID=A0ABS9Z7G4_9HYPH|nr:Na+/H+ antiporter subunit E [Candidatus Rhodoblastus alkanivorans]MCI4680122.1 Na+/H+ antiporter subunit E [Candidatus Rhodoblastus alkanivorans]MCI4683376.1 Na+/H+ antiporter subunit E [Candidatus Rhodoblastus alkanivorans]MDI4640686.1 Na+/H+ antiporter subunit E [Rhodoblastus acidophilus]